MAKRRYCSFCGKRDDEVEQLVAGPCVEVCNECIDMMYQIVHKPKPFFSVKQTTAQSRKVVPFSEFASKATK